MSTAKRPTATTESGMVQGTMEDGVAAFRSIPYAASPLNELRFAAPQPQPAWLGTRDASGPGPSVPQGASRLESVMGKRSPDWNEDGSLTVNIWTPANLEGPSPGHKLSVLVWFHGGGFSSGSGGWDWYDGRNLAAAGDIVVVTANYRVGPLGFLYLPEFGVENLGIQDQGAVLNWVRRNIGGFGGNPDEITVGGQSAGAYSSLYLALSPVTGPLVKRIIAQSAPLGLVPQLPEDATKNTHRFIEILGLGSSADLLSDLRALPAGRLLDAYRQLSGELATPGSAAPAMYPVLGGSGIPIRWEQALVEGRLDGKQLLTGTTKNEMTAFFAFDPHIKSITAEQAREMAARHVDGGAERFDRIAIQQQHGEPHDTLADLESEILFRDGTLAVATHQVETGVPTYVYQFDYAPADDPAHLGATHCVDAPFFFDTIDAYPNSPMLGP
ncbi:carboxylesterase family protein, partial [Paenarthrobacter sp. NPDC091669]|uniref:carboxylesterase family protein n=1 Tax=Paenarthrobacter sp. NPDC091669 TaxID=3364384 RepID=UPI0038201F60